jgi:D-3-phosphoglycerate dehydrogenase
VAGAGVGEFARPRLRVLVVGDPYFTTDDFRRGLSPLSTIADLTFLQIETTEVPPPVTASERSLREYAGAPSTIAAAVDGHEVLIVHGAAVSADVFSTPGLRLVCCARGGPVNVDIAAATAAGVLVCNTPGKNAEAVAELTIAFALTLIRGVAPSTRATQQQSWTPGSTFDGREFFGREAHSVTLGLVGLGQVGGQVAWRARRLGFRVYAHDPYVAGTKDLDAELMTLPSLLERSDVVSLHARLTEDNHRMMAAEQFALMRSGAYFINTAREQLVDEAALLAALGSGRLAGAALDVVERHPSGRRNPLLDAPTVMATPHIGGATYETLARGAEMVVVAVQALADGRVPPFVVNPQALAAALESAPAAGAGA